MIEYQEPFGLRVHLEGPDDVRSAERWSKSGYWGLRRIDRIEVTNFALAGERNMIDVHLRERE